MKKRFIPILASVLVMFLCGCCLSHEWVDASCSAPKTCSRCGETEGEPLEHQWIDATCTNPKTCSECAMTEGSKLPHIFGPEELQRPDYVNATALYVKTCKNCGEQSQRTDDLEKLMNMGTFLMTPEEFSNRFTNMLSDMQVLLGKDEYVSYIDDGSTSRALKMYVTKKDANGKIQTVGEFEMTDADDHRLLPEQKAEANILWKVQGTVKGEMPALLAMLSLWRTADPSNTLEDYRNYQEALRILSPPNARIDMFSVPTSKYGFLKIQHKGGTTYEFTLKAQRNHY